MGKQTLKISLLVVLSLAALGLLWFAVKKTAGQEAQPTEMTIFVADGCPHCLEVEKYIDENDLRTKLPLLAFKEVSKDQNNAREFVARAKECGLNTNRLGVPVLYDGHDCYEGNEEIIYYLKTAAGI